MLLDLTWNRYKRELNISYIAKNGTRQFYTKSLNYIKTYEYDEHGEFETWNGRRCRAVFKPTTTYIPNDFDILEYMYNLPSDVNKAMHAQYFPKLYTFDIETEFKENEFPYPDKAEHKVTAISLCGTDLSCMIFGLKNMSEESIALLRERVLNYIRNNEFARHIVGNNTPKVIYKFFNTEEEMLKTWFTEIMPKTACLAGWNSYGFDYQYLVNRLKRLFGEQEAKTLIKKSSPTREVQQYSWEEMSGDRISVLGPCHTILLDYMKIVDKYDYVLRPYESLSLDWVASKAVGAHKVEYEGDLQQLYERDYEWYYFYNAVDSILVQLIHQKLKALESPCAVSSLTLCTLLNSMGQVALTTAAVFEEFYNDNKKVVYKPDETERVKHPYEGAFCGCVAGRFEWNVCYDFKSLYPTQVETCNLSFENILFKTVPNAIAGQPPIIVPWSEEELDRFKKDPNYFVTVNNNVYKNDKDYVFRRMQKKYKANRDIYKYTGQRIESQLITEIDRLIAEKEKLSAV